MTKQLKRLNIKPPYNTMPIPPTGHRYITFRRTTKKTYFIVTVKQTGARQFISKKLALCYKFIMLLKIKSKYYTNGKWNRSKTTSNLSCKRST